MEDYKNSKEYQMDLEIEDQYKSDDINDTLDLVREGYKHNLRILRHEVPCYTSERFEEAREFVSKVQTLVNANPDYYGEIFGGFRPDIVKLTQTAKFVQLTTTITTDEEKIL